jgi:hypothetical protein
MIRIWFLRPEYTGTNRQNHETAKTSQKKAAEVLCKELQTTFKNGTVGFKIADIQNAQNR